MRKSQVHFNTKTLENVIFKNLVPEQTRRLVAYAKDTVQQIGNTIKAYHSAHNMDKTGNLLNSLCWGVSYRGKLEESGFYREANSLDNSWLHEWSGYPLPVNGHAQAENYINKYGASMSNGWRVFFAILAPYWGYWEEGFTMKIGGGDSKAPSATRFLKFAVMTQFYDKIQKDLKPSDVRFRVTKDIWYSENSLMKAAESRRYDKWTTKYKPRRK